MKRLKNNMVYIFAGLPFISQSCTLTPVTNKQITGIYVAGTGSFTDTLIVKENGIYQHFYYESGALVFSQNGTWKPTVKNYYELSGWRADSTAFGGADIQPLMNKLTGTIKFAYPLVTPEDIDYVKVGNTK